MTNKFKITFKVNIDPLLTELQWEDISNLLNGKQHFQIQRNLEQGLALVYNLVTKKEIEKVYYYLKGVKKQPVILSVLDEKGTRQGYTLTNLGTEEIPDWKQIYNVRDEDGNLLPEIIFPDENYTVYDYKPGIIDETLPESDYEDPETGKITKVKEPKNNFYGW